MSLALIVIRSQKDADGLDEVVYSRYLGRERTHRFAYHSPLTPHWVEEIRNAPEQFQIEENQQQDPANTPAP